MIGVIISLQTKGVVDPGRNVEELFSSLASLAQEDVISVGGLEDVGATPNGCRKGNVLELADHLSSWKPSEIALFV